MADQQLYGDDGKPLFDDNGKPMMATTKAPGGWDHPLADMWEGAKTSLSKLNPFDRPAEPDYAAAWNAPKPHLDPVGAARTVWKGIGVPSAQAVGEGATDLLTMGAMSKAAGWRPSAAGTLRTMGRGAKVLGEAANIAHPGKVLSMAGDAAMDAAAAREFDSAPGYPKLSQAPAPPPPTVPPPPAVEPGESFPGYPKLSTAPAPPPRPAAPPSPLMQTTGTGSAVPAPKPAGTLPWTALAPPPEPPPPVPNVGTGTGSAVPPLGPAGAEPWTAPAPPREPPPPVPNVGTGTGSATPPLGPAGDEPWTLPGTSEPSPQASTPPPPIVTGTGTQPAGGPVSWDQWQPPTRHEPPGGASDAAEIPAAPPKAEAAAATEPATATTPKRKGASASVAGKMTPEQNADVERAILHVHGVTGSARDTAQQLGLDMGYVRDVVSKQSGKAPGQPSAAVQSKLDGLAAQFTAKDIDAAIERAANNPKMREALERRKATLGAIVTKD